MPGARVYVNGAQVPAATKDERQAAKTASSEEDGSLAQVVRSGRVLLRRDCRVVFGRRHFFRLDVAARGPGESNSAAVTGSLARVYLLPLRCIPCIHSSTVVFSIKYDSMIQ